MHSVQSLMGQACGLMQLLQCLHGIANLMHIFAMRFALVAVTLASNSSLYKDWTGLLHIASASTSSGAYMGQCSRLCQV